MKKIFNYARIILKNYIPVLSAVVGLLFLIEVLGLVTPWLFGGLIDSLNVNTQKTWNYYVYLIVIAISVNSLFSYIKARIDIQKYVFKIDKDFELLAMKNILKFPVGQLKADNTGEIQSVVQKGISSFSEYIKIVLFNILPTLVFSTITLIWLFSISFEMFLIAALFVIITICYMYWTNSQMKDRFVDTRTKWQKIDSHRMEVIRNASLIIYYDQIKEVLDDYKKRYSTVEKIGIKDWVHYVTRIHLMNILRILAMFGVLFLGAYGVVSSKYSAGQFVIIYSWVSSVFSKAGLLRQSFRMIMRLSPGIIKYLEMIERPLDLVETGSKKSISYGKISFENVSYSYKEIKGVKSLKSYGALKKINFELLAGESLAIVGPSGAGKSTLVGLLMRAFNPDSGGVYIDNIPLFDYASSYKRDIGYIEQRPKLFDQSVRDNLLFGVNSDVKLNDELIYQTLELVGLEEKVRNLSNGLDSRIGEQGVKFSGGESQRLSLAGIFLKNPKLFILDEATSALDEISQKKIKNALKIAGKKSTSITIAHRLSTISHCDKVLVLNNGEIEFFGIYPQAKEKSSLFKKMIVESQLEKIS